MMDLGKLVAGAASQLQNLQQVCDVINTNQLEKLYVEVETNTKALVDAGTALERSGAALAVMNVVLAGSSRIICWTSCRRPGSMPPRRSGSPST